MRNKEIDPIDEEQGRSENAPSVANRSKRRQVDTCMPISPPTKQRETASKTKVTPSKYNYKQVS